MKYLCVGEPYEKNGEKKMSWKRVGEIFTSKAGKEYVKIYHMPGVLISVFEDDKNKEATKPLTTPKDGSFDEFGANTEVPF